MNNETVGITTVIVGVVIVVGAVRGTWKKIFADVISTGGSGSNSNTASGSASGNLSPNFPGISVGPFQGIGAQQNNCAWGVNTPYGFQCIVNSWGLGYTNVNPQTGPSELIGASAPGVVVY